MIEKFVFQVADIKFCNNGFAIIRTTRDDSVAGKFSPTLGMCYQAQGTWMTHPTYGPQFKLESATTVRLPNPEALGRFLVLNLKGKKVGDAFISGLIESCKANDLNLEEMLDKNQRDELIDCVGKRNAKKIDTLLAEWPNLKPTADLLSPLMGYGLSEAKAKALVDMLGNRALELVEREPYNLILLLDGVSFLVADKIAMKVGLVTKTDALRLKAALATGMRDATNNGDLGVSRKKLIDRTLVLVNDAVIENGKRVLPVGMPLAVPASMLAATLNDMVEGKNTNDCAFSAKLTEFPDEKGEMVVWYAPLVQAEQVIAKRLTRLNTAPRPDLLERLADAVEKLGKPFVVDQLAAIEMALTHPVSIITGGPGCGKSYMISGLLALFDLAGLTGYLVAPTGKAAKRITESTGRSAQTIHSLIGYTPGGKCEFNEDLPLIADYLVVDEASMVDTELMAALLRATRNSCRIIIVGDYDQLASVGPGQVLRDLIRSNEIPVKRLTKGWRFGGGIASAAAAINAGKMPDTSDDGQFVFVNTDSPTQDLIATVKELLASGVNENDIQVLSPTHKGDAGCISLNNAMQTLLNPDNWGKGSPVLMRDTGVIRVGDRVIQGKNDREIKLVNGDIGMIETISSDTGAVSLLMPEKDTPVNIPKDKTQQLSLAYAITVHKSQGAEAPYVLIALDPSASFMLRRNLVYTAVTRGSTKVILFSSRSTVARAVFKGEPPEGSRRTSLVAKLKAAFAVPDTLATAMRLEQTLSDVPF